MKVVCWLYLLLGGSLAFGQVAPYEVPLWSAGAPGFEHLKDEPTEAEDWWIKNIHNPSVTIYPADSNNATGVGVIVVPGGGHRALVFNSEGHDAAVYLQRLGITVFVLKYRLAREEGSLYSIEGHAAQDLERAVRLMRYKAPQLGINAEKVGLLGFSAGGELVSMVSYRPGDVKTDATDPIDQESSRPDFQMLVYPGPLGVPEELPSSPPPLFVVAARNDECCAPPSLRLLNLYFEAGYSVEAHIYAKGGHAFNMGYRTEYITLKNWPARMSDWLRDNWF
ncbi:MAG: alpha/beta hydrolase [Marinoscillum sp.]|uniref:alpha/beta hydrolase n=1 Tax=Marinoscillum sp. TaxID=2024838 RepID=UPI0032F2BCB2